MARKRLRCLLGIHEFGQAPSPDEQPHGPNEWICRWCGKRKIGDWGVIRGFGGPS